MNAEDFFWRWMFKHHSHIVYAILAAFTGIAIAVVFTIAAIWIFPDQFWKIALTVVGISGIAVFLIKIVVSVYVDEYNEARRL